MKHKHEEVQEVLLEGLNQIHERGVPNYSITHFSFYYEGMDQYFIFSGSGAHRKTLKQLKWG